MLYSPENNLFASLTENQSQYAYSYHEMHNNTDINSAVYYRQKSNTSVIHIIVANYKHLSQSCQQSRYLGKKQADKDADLQKS